MSIMMSAKKSFTLQFPRALALFKALPKAPHSHISIEELSVKLDHLYVQFKAPRKTLLRDLNSLSDILDKGNIEKISASGRKSSSFRLSSNATLNLDKSRFFHNEFQSLAIVHSFNFLKNYFPQSWQSTLFEQFEDAQKNLSLKNQQIWLNKFGFALDGAFQSYLNPPNDIKEIIFQCIHNDNNWMEILYHPENLQKTIQTYSIKPHGIIARGRKQYLIASKISDKNKIHIRTFSMHRVLQAKEIPERLSINITDVDIRKAIEQYEFEGYFNDDEQAQKIVLKCSKYMLSELNYAKIHETQNISCTEFKDFILTAEMPISRSFVDWLVQNAAHIKLLEPAELQNEIKFRLQYMAENYDIEIIYNKFKDNDFFDFSTENKSEEYSAIQTLESILIDDNDSDYYEKTYQNFDEIYLQAIEYIKNRTYISTKELQQYFGCSYNLAANIIGKMENESVIITDATHKKIVLIKG